MKVEADKTKSSISRQLWIRILQFKNRLINFHGDPQFVARGMAIGVFVAATPSMPFQTAIAIALAFILRSSKAAATIGVWISNPITFPIFYLASYKVGTLLFGISAVISLLSNLIEYIFDRRSKISCTLYFFSSSFSRR